MSIEVADLRKGDRFVFVHPPTGTFGSVDVSVIDVSLAGAQIQHAQALRIGTTARLAFRQDGEIVSTQGQVLWSHFLKTPTGLIYCSGMRIQPDTSYATAVNAFYKSGAAQRDTESMERKRQRMLEREKERQASKPRNIPTAGGMS
jgi:hypothetical protein